MSDSNPTWKPPTRTSFPTTSSCACARSTPWDFGWDWADEAAPPEDPEPVSAATGSGVFPKLPVGFDWSLHALVFGPGSPGGAPPGSGTHAPGLDGSGSLMPCWLGPSH